MKIRFPLGRFLVVAVVSIAGSALPGGVRAADADYPVLSQPAIVSPKAAGAAMLGLARAGQRLVAVGERGIVLLSDDQGGRWRQARVPVSVSLTAVRFVTERTGWAVGHFGVVLRSDDGGESWVKQLDGVAAARLAEQAASQMAREGAPEAERLRESSLHLVEEGPDKPFLDLFFANERDGFVIGSYNLIFRTRDGGQSWTPWMSRVENPKGLHLYGVAQGGGGALYIVGEQGLLLRSTDGGERFAALPSPYKGSWFGVLAAGEGSVLAYGLRGSLYRSTDRGESWRAIDTGIASGLGTGLTMGDGTLVLASQTGDLLTSRDGGASFQPAAGRKLPVTALAERADGRLAVASLRGVLSLDPSASPNSPLNAPAKGAVR